MLRRLYLTVLIPFAFACACQGSSALPRPLETYQVRAQVVALEGTGEAQRVVLQHEAIDAFKNREGKAERMPAMKMAFGVGSGVDAAAFTPGSKHDITFDAVWGREPMIRVTAAKRLPDDTALSLEGHE